MVAATLVVTHMLLEQTAETLYFHPSLHLVEGAVAAIHVEAVLQALMEVLEEAVGLVLLVIMALVAEAVLEK
jgi:hypothetical protein